MKLAAFTCGPISGASSRLRSFYLFSEADSVGLEVIRPETFKEGLSAEVIHIQKVYSYEVLRWMFVYRLLGKKVIYDIDDQVNRRREFHRVFIIILLSSILTVDTVPRKFFWKKFFPFKKIEVINDIVDSPTLENDLINCRKNLNSRNFFWLGNSSNFKSIVRVIQKDYLLPDHHFIVSMEEAAINKVKKNFPHVTFIPWFDGVALDPRVDAKFMILNHDTDKNSRMKSDNKMVLALAAGFIPLVSNTCAYAALAKRLDADFLIFENIGDVCSHAERVLRKIDSVDFFNKASKIIQSDYSRGQVLSVLKKII
jgi:glycosyltransferase involved in cell wall biosynthesis